MTISYPLSLPASPNPSQVQLAFNDIVGVSTSGFTAQQEVQQYQGQFWTAQVVYPSMTRAQAEPVLAILAALKGQYGTLLLGDPLGTSPLGVATGTPLVNGSNAVRSSSLAIKGWTPSITGILKAGDYLQITGTQQRLYKVLADANSDISGNCTVDIWPNLRDTYADGTAITISNCKGTFRLGSNQRAWQQRVGNFYAISFSAIEAQ